MTDVLRFTAASSEQTALLARILAATAKPGDCFLLTGEIGAGKTHFARSFIQARQGGAAEDVPSPTFTLVQTYDDPRGTEIWHSDLYRLSDPQELDELGLESALDTAITLIEWPDRLDFNPDGATRISFQTSADENSRDITISGDTWTREVDATRFLIMAGWEDAQVAPLAGDASARRYMRLHRDDQRAVFMDDAAGGLPAFIRMTDWLRDAGHGAPQILARDDDNGFLLLEDLGDDLVARVIADEPGLAPQIYQRITEFLVELHKDTPPEFVKPLDGPEMAAQVGLFAEWYPKAAGASPAAINRATEIANQIEQLYPKLCADIQPVLALRDFHAENLIWRGEAPLGLLDYQDAVAAHPAYDLVSCLQDARRDVGAKIEADEIARYIASTGQDETRFRAAYALIGVQRQLRIMGIFTRLCQRDHKPRYLEFMPLVWRYIRQNLENPALAPLATIIDDLPEPTPEIIERIRSHGA